jgi:predicted short-subunit dehydrogenase-like oxidoreductase (DUF2520 family)
MVKEDLRVAVVGYGKVGRVLVRAFDAIGYPLTAIVTRQRDLNDPRAIASIADLPAEANFVILCLRDDAIRETVTTLTMKGRKADDANLKILCHTAGAISAEVLAPARAQGWQVMAWHPMQTLTGDEGLELLRSVTFGIDGDPKAVEAGMRLAGSLGGVPVAIMPDRRAEYHLGAVFACNLMAGLVGESIDLLKSSGMDEDQARAALKPLLETTLANIESKGMPDAITGPLRRGDAITVGRHLEILKDQPGALAIYRQLSMGLLKRLGDGEGKRGILKMLEME